jgi:predicted enzyme related to lactoylglutathione lyase
MDVTQTFIQLTSPEPAKLHAFYRDVVGLTPQPDIGETTFKLGENTFFGIDGHSETKGPNTQPARTIIDFWVNDVQKERERMESQGVKFIRKEGQEFWGGVISTFVDPDGNYAQLIEFRQPNGQ